MNTCVTLETNQRIIIIGSLVAINTNYSIISLQPIYLVSPYLQNLRHELCYAMQQYFHVTRESTLQIWFKPIRWLCPERGWKTDDVLAQLSLSENPTKNLTTVKTLYVKSESEAEWRWPGRARKIKIVREGKQTSFNPKYWNIKENASSDQSSKQKPPFKKLNCIKSLTNICCFVWVSEWLTTLTMCMI